MKAHVVIGAGFGDEGKGLMTDYLASQPGDRALVVRFNGGSQAGHTVQTPDGVRSVFHHIGAGTLAGADTFLSRFFIVNPMAFSKEWWGDQAGLPKRPETTIFVDPYAPVTTPYDMLINQEIEKQRGANRHGSCGVGINETVTRMERGVCPIYAVDLVYPRRLRRILADIAKEWVPKRVEELGLVRNEEFNERAESRDIMDWMVGASDGTMRENVRLSTWEHAVQDYNRVVFEGAQGLLLDEQHEFFPHVTRSRTGLTNVLPLASEAGIRRLEVVYVTRSYMTRHGRGPFPTERANLVVADETNVWNEYQHGLRFGDLDVPLIAAAIDKDQEEASRKWAGRFSGVRTGLAITCNDQYSALEKVRELSFAAQVPLRYMSIGPTRAHVSNEADIVVV